MKLIAMYALCALINFPAHEGRAAFSIRMVNEVTIESSWEVLTDRATVVLPKNLRAYKTALDQMGKSKITELFRREDPVEIQLGYNGQYSSEFTGYITKVSAEIPLVIELEDEMRKLKRGKLYLSYKSCSLQTLIEKIAPGYELDVIQANLGQVTLKNMTPAEILQKLKDDFGIYSYFVGKKLVVGKIYVDDIDSDPVKFVLEKNVKSNDLKFRESGADLVQVNATSKKLNGDEIKVSVGESGGVELNLSYFNIPNKTELKKLAEEDYKKYLSGGVEGSFTGFGWPVVQHGDKVEVKSVAYPERDNTSFVKAVNQSWGIGGWEREIVPGKNLK